MEEKRKLKAVVEFIEHENLFELLQMRGNFWRVMGCSHNSKNFLFAEEVLYLAEKGQLLVQHGSDLLGLEFVYSRIIDGHLPLSCYMTYLKLKVIVLKSSGDWHNIIASYDLYVRNWIISCCVTAQRSKSDRSVVMMRFLVSIKFQVLFY
jgi:hypothetical protein